MHKKLLLYFLFFCLPLAVQGQSIEVPDLSGLPQPTQAKALRYWFDDDTEVKVVNQLSGQQTLDVSELLDGLHTLNYQIVDDKDIAAYISTSIFIKMSNSSDASTPQSVSYWFDDNSTDRKFISSSGIQMLDASNLTEGLHTLNYQVICSDGTPACIYTSIFMKTKGSLEEGNVKASRLLYWFDDNTEIKHADMAQSIQLLDASELHDGLHTLHYQVQCENGDVTPVMSAIFMRLSIDVTATSAKSLRYWFDDDASTVNVISVANGTQTLNVADLPIGMHTLNYQLIDSNGNVTPTVTRMFLKQFDKVLSNSHNGITKYEYWLNEHSNAMQSITLADAPNPYTLIALLPMQKEPLNTLNFHYEVNNGNPMIYAKNEFHIRFHDAAGYWVDESKPFIDYSIYKEVNPVGEISATQTFPKVAQNDIRWYTMQSLPGDTAAFKLSQPATIQVFAPSGEEVFKTSAAESVKWDGIHTWEEGTYYIAVHDVTGTQSTMKLEYMHMDKYDVVDWNVRKVGNGGCSTITFKGNGFRDLYAVDLHGPGGEIISSINVGYISDAETAVSFDFTGARIGEYSAVFHFAEEDKRFAGIVTVEEAKDLTLDIDVQYPRTFLSGTYANYTISVTNQGNMTAYRVPLYIYISSRTEEGIGKIDIDGLNLPKLLDGLDRDSIPGEWLEYEKRIGDGHYFITTEGYDDDLKDSVTIRSAYFFVDIAPQSTKSISLKLHANEYVNVWFTLPKDVPAINALNVIPQNAPNRASRASMKEHYCCIRERVECIGGLIGDVVGFANTIGGLTGIPQAKALAIADCAVGTLNTVISAAGEIACGENNVEESFYDKLKRLKDGISISGTIVGCFEKFLSGSKLLKIGDLSALVGISTHATTWVDCGIAFSEKKPNCPPNPGGGGGGSQPVNSCEPNDIYGYLSPSGSKFIARDSVETVNYRIEFENDPIFATSAAHVVDVRDTLDARYFDLSTFVPTYFTIAGKREQLEGTVNFVRTVDMRPKINTIVQVKCMYEEHTGAIRWLFTSLDPITIEPAKDVMQGFLPVNTDGISGIGDVGYRIGLKKGLADGTEIPNRASNIFDYNDPVPTPTWINIVDTVAPTSTISDLSMLNDTTIHITADAYDARSGVWKYEWYVQCGEDAPWWKEGETDTLCFDYRIYEDIDYGFCVLATDSAGNVEQKVLLRESRFKIDEYGNVETYIETPKDSGGNTPPVIYDLSGRRLTKPQENRINIIGRKKVLYRKYKQ